MAKKRQEVKLKEPVRIRFKQLANWKIQCKLPPKTKRFCPLVLK